MPVLLTPPYLQFFDANGLPLAGGTVDTYAAGTTTRKATYTDSGGMTLAPNPILLDSSGRPESGNGSIWIQGAYKFIVKDANGIVIETTDNVSSFNSTSSTATNSYFQSFSGNGSQTSFTLSQDLGTDENAIMVFVNNTPSVTNTPFFQAINSIAAQTTFTLTQDLGTNPNALHVYKNTTSLGFQVLRPTTDYTVSGTTLTLTAAPGAFTPGVLVFDNPILNDTSTGVGLQVQPPSAYTLNGTNLSFAVAPKTGTNNILVWAPSTLLGAAAISAAAADASATAAANSQAAAASSATAAATSASSAAAYAAAKNQWTFSTNTSMAAPGTGVLRFNNATIGSATAMAISNLSANSGNPDLSAWLATWDDTPSSPRGEIYIFKDNANFAIFNITGANVDNTGWKQITLAYVSGAGSFANNDALLVGFVAYGTTTVVGGVVGPASALDNSIALFNGTSGNIIKSGVALGTAGQVLTSNGPGLAPTMQTASGGSQVLLQTQIVSTAVNTVDFTANINSTYKHYIIECIGVQQTGGGGFYARFQQGGSFVTSANYNSVVKGGTTSSGTAADAGSTAGNYISISGSLSFPASTPYNFFVDLIDPANASQNTVIGFKGNGRSSGGGGVLFQLVGSGSLSTTAATTGISFGDFGGTNLTAGTFKLYGVL